MSSISRPGLAGFDAPKLEALIEMLYLAVSADGEFSEEERAHFAQSVESLTDRRFDAEALGRLIERMESDNMERADRLASIKERLGDAGARKAAVSVAIQAMACDGILRTSEREFILDAAEALEIDRGVAADLVKTLGV